jgi:predicted P-loop ATPase
MSEQLARQCVFVGTTNQDEFLGDPTGARRFWPVRVGDINVTALEQEADQLWAEADHRYRAGESWWLDPTLDQARALASEEFTARDAWSAIVEDWVSSRFTPVRVDEVLAGPIDKPKRDWSNADRMRVASILKGLGWVRVQVGPASKRERVWRRPDDV